MRVADIVAGVVRNVVEVDPAERPAFTNGWPDAGEAGPGWTYDGEAFYPPEPDPVSIEAERAAMVCSPAQMRLTLLASGKLATVQAIADSSPEASILWEYGTQFTRTSPLIDALGGPNGFTPEQIDNLFRAAMALKL